jgi:hypothetical protein
MIFGYLGNLCLRLLSGQTQTIDIMSGTACVNLATFTAKCPALPLNILLGAYKAVSALTFPSSLRAMVNP